MEECLAVQFLPERGHVVVRREGMVHGASHICKLACRHAVHACVQVAADITTVLDEFKSIKNPVAAVGMLKGVSECRGRGARWQ